MAKASGKTDPSRHKTPAVRQNSIVTDSVAIISQVDRSSLDRMMQQLYDQLIADINDGLLLPKEKIQLFSKLLDIKFPRPQHTDDSAADSVTDRLRSFASRLADLADQ